MTSVDFKLKLELLGQKQEFRVNCRPKDGNSDPAETSKISHTTRCPEEILNYTHIKTIGEGNKQLQGKETLRYLKKIPRTKAWYLSA